MAAPTTHPAVRLTHPEKRLFESGFTKRDLADYYRAVAEVILQQLADRPVTRIRFPDGVGGVRFFEKNTPKYAPSWLRRMPLSANPGSKGPAKIVTYPFIEDVPGLEWMSNQSAIEFHTPQWRVGPRGGIRKPDRLVIDLDPGEGSGLDECVAAARLIRARLAEDDLEVWPVTSGGKGIHLYSALSGRRAARSVHEYAGKVARELAAAHPDELVAEVGTEKRVGKVFIDWSQNSRHKTTVCVYSLRAQPRPTVSTPLRWEEVEAVTESRDPDDLVFDSEAVLKRVSEHGDLYAPVVSLRQSLPSGLAA
jgi:bifunctional non-homologous end joining protein LigD